MTHINLEHHCPGCPAAPALPDQIGVLTERLGCAIISIARGTPIPYAYTVGLTERDQPELYVQGAAHPDTAAAILYVVAANYPLPGDYLDGRRVSVGEHHARLENMTDASLLAVAVGRYGEERVTAMKLIQEED